MTRAALAAALFLAGCGGQHAASTSSPSPTPAVTYLSASDVDVLPGKGQSCADARRNILSDPKTPKALRTQLREHPESVNCGSATSSLPTTPRSP